MSGERLKESFEYVARQGDLVPLFFYSDLFLRNPELREMFPVSMAQQRDRFFDALGRIVADVDNHPRLTTYLHQLGRDHRKFGVVEEHYTALGASLLATLAHFCGSAWTADLAADWRAAFGLVSRIMIKAATIDEGHHPAWWDATVVGHETRSTNVGVIRVAPEQRLDYVPGQSVSIESELRPRIWRYYSIANASREDGTLDFHIKVVDGGALSGALARGARAGQRLRLGAPVGTLSLDENSDRDIVMLAGSTGLAPLKAILEQISWRATPPRVHLFFGARTSYDLYDLAGLDKLAAQYDWLAVTSAVSDDPYFPGQRGTVAEVAAKYGPWTDRDAYICGSPRMVSVSVSQMRMLGMPAQQIHFENYDWRERRTSVGVSNDNRY